MNFIIDKIIAILVAAITALSAFAIYQDWQIERQKSAYQLKIERLERHYESQQAFYEHTLNEQHRLALEKQNELLESARSKEQEIQKKLQQSQTETKAHEKRIKTLSNQLESSNNSLHKLTQKASRLAKKAVDRRKECLPSNTKTATDRPKSTESKQAKAVIEATTQMGAELSQFAEQVTNDYAELQKQCKELQGWVNIVQQD